MKSEGGEGYVQLFVYRVPESNREALRDLLKQIVQKLRQHGTLNSEFYRLHSNEAFQGFATISSTFDAVPAEELWVELDHYHDRQHRDHVMASLAKDPGAGALFRQLRPLVSKGYTIAMGEFEGMLTDFRT
jgi:uncharacterized protein YbaA (DUF1428 family)